MEMMDQETVQEADQTIAVEEALAAETEEALTEEAKGEALIENLARCTKQHALSAKKNAKYLSNQLKADQYIAKIAM